MRYCFGQFCIDLDRRELQQAGKTVTVRSQVFDLLSFLVQSEGKAIAKEDLLETLWPGRKLSEGVLSACVREARKALGDDGHHQNLIKTLHGYGVRFLAEVHSQPALSTEQGITLNPTDHTDGAQAAQDNTVKKATHQAPASTFTEGDVDERRLVTYLCCRALTPAQSSTDDIETMHIRNKQLSTTVHQATQRLGGQVTQARGHEITGVFGLDRTQEDATLRAVLAAQEMCDFTEQPLCVGIDTGRVLAGVIKNTHTWHITQIDVVERRARKLLCNRQSNTIWLSNAAWQQVQGQVKVEKHTLDDQPIYRVSAIKPNLPRSPQRRERLYTRFVGRQPEMDTLRELAEQAFKGQGQLVGIVGDAGIGKTRLLQELQCCLKPKSVTWISACCRSYGADSPFGLLSDLIRTVCEIDVDETRASLTSKICSVCEQSDIDPSGEKAFRHLLNLDPKQNQHQDPQQYKQNLFSALERLIVGSASGPRVVAIEDLHHIDSSSETCLHALASRITGSPLLLLLTYRTGYQPPFLGRSNANQLALRPLGEVPSTQLVVDVSESQPLDADKRRTIVDKAQGNPLFLQELTLQAAEAGAQSDSHSNTAVPNAIQIVIRARIDKLPKSAKMLLQKASIIGNTFDLTLLEKLIDPAEQDVSTDLDRLQQDEFIVQTGWQPSTFAFRHGLTQVATYESLLEQDRHNWHRDVATNLQQLRPLVAYQQPEALAVHYQRSRDWTTAQTLWTRAAKGALDRFAEGEALVHLEHALDCLEAGGPTSNQKSQELEIQTMRLRAFQLTRGFAAHEVEQTQQRISILTNLLGGNHNDPPEIFMRASRGEFSKAEKMARALVQNAKKENNPVLLTTALDLLGLTLTHLGRLVESSEIYNRAIEMYQKSNHNPDSPHDPCVSSYCMLALNYVGMGFVDQAQILANAATDLARELHHLPSLAMANYLHAFALAELGLFDLAAQQSQQAIALAQQAPLVLWQSGAQIVNGWARFHLGEKQAGLDQVEQAFQDWSKTNTRIATPLFHAILAELYLITNQTDHATEHIDAGIEVTNQDNQRFREPELLRYKAKALLATGAKLDEVDHWLLQAQTSARELQTKLFELRIVTDRVQLWQGTASEQELGDMLDSLLDWFSEGFDLPDLIQAKTVLQQVRHNG